MVLPMLDADDALAEPFNAYVMEQADALSGMTGLMDGADSSDLDRQSDVSVQMEVKEVAGTGRISLTVNEYAYGHGAAHGNYFISYRHYLIGEKRGLVASDVFSGKEWEQRLADAAWAKLQSEHKEWLQVSSVDEIAEAVVDPSRWDFSDSYGLTIQFEPYEVAAYAYGAPTITIAWETLSDIAADSQSAILYGQ
jgi:hypothetical protein